MGFSGPGVILAGPFGLVLGQPSGRPPSAQPSCTRRRKHRKGFGRLEYRKALYLYSGPDMATSKRA